MVKEDLNLKLLAIAEIDFNLWNSIGWGFVDRRMIVQRRVQSKIRLHVWIHDFIGIMYHGDTLTLFSTYTHFNTLKKTASVKHPGKK